MRLTKLLRTYPVAKIPIEIGNDVIIHFQLNVVTIFEVISE